MKKTPSLLSFLSRPWVFLVFGFTVILLAAYGRLLFDPSLHTACPENDTWNLPVRWSVLSSLREGLLPLWNPLSAFGIPWLATWQTETFYPGTLLFSVFGLNFWNYSGVLHLIILACGIYRLLRNAGTDSFWAFLAAAVSLLNGCAYNHLGSNSSMDTMAWAPWLLVAVQNISQQKKSGFLQFSLFLALQVFAGYPQIIYYSLGATAAYGVFLAGWNFPFRLALPLLAGLLVSACQWLPSLEYFFLNAARLPAVPDNPGFFLPPENLKTFFSFNALWRENIPDFVVSPTFFYFNLYSGLVPLAGLGLGLVRWSKLKPVSRFFLAGFFFFIVWMLGWPLMLLGRLHLPAPAFLEPAKSWVLFNLFELTALGLIGKDLFPRPDRWKWAVLIVAVTDLLIGVWAHPLEKNLAPSDPILQQESQKIETNLGQGRVLILPNSQEHSSFYTPIPSADRKPLFKYFVPNSNLFVSLPLANFYGSTWPTWGSLAAQFYFKNAFPYDQGRLMDLLGVDLLLLTENAMPSSFEKIHQEGVWTLWRNPGSLGSRFFFFGKPQELSLREIFQAFADGRSDPLHSLYLDAKPLGTAARRLLSEQEMNAPDSIGLPEGKAGYLVVTQNAMPDWRAWVDGKPADLFRADGIFQCVAFSTGSKRVVFRYEPASFRLGLFLSLLSLAGIIFWAGKKIPTQRHEASKKYLFFLD
jgi:hypothetical protein